MLDRIFGSDSFVAVTEALNAATMRQQVIANNLANANTPGYKAQHVVFEQRLSAALQQRTGAQFAVPQQPLSSIRPEVVTDNSTSMRTDGNNVDPEKESADLAINSIRYQALVQSLVDQLHDIKTAITGV